ncbi:MAG TPA: PilZ domain-containing protein [Terriglobales bacterium]|nr:PilZ domain-containing protein [Terriglobales bacterium]
MNFAAVKAARIPTVSERRGALMLGSLSDERQASRFFLTAATKVRTGTDGEEHVGLVRDLSGNGLFVYSDFIPECGSQLQVVLQTSTLRSRHVSVACKGRVVRVEPNATGAAVGIAIAVEEYEFCTMKTRPQLPAGQPIRQ